MKVFLAFILCGAAGFVASDTCSEKEVEKCVQTPDDPNIYPDTVEKLDDICRPVLSELDCQIAYADRCPNTLTGAFAEGLKEFRRVYGKLCKKGDPLREKYMEKASCLSSSVEGIEDECAESVTIEEYCERHVAVLECSKEGVTKKCGKDGEELFAEIYKPKFLLQKVFC